MALSLGDTFLQNTATSSGIGIDASGYTTIQSKRHGMGTGTANNRDLQFLTWNGTMTNGTITLMTEVGMGENGHVGIFGLNVMQGARGTSRVYYFTGRYAQTAMTSVQGGNRGAGEDASLNFTGGANTIGITLTASGYTSTVGYSVWAMVGIQNTDRWMTD
jgi:hypothetical protein